MKQSRVDPLLQHARERLAADESEIAAWAMPGRFLTPASGGHTPLEMFTWHPPFIVLLTDKRLRFCQTDVSTVIYMKGKSEDGDLDLNTITAIRLKNLLKIRTLVIETTGGKWTACCMSRKVEYTESMIDLTERLQQVHRAYQVAAGQGEVASLDAQQRMALDEAYAEESDIIEDQGEFDESAAAAGSDLTGQLEKIITLYKDGLLTDEEFASMKNQLIS